MYAEIVNVGTELTAGLTVDTNGAWLAGQLGAVGVGVSRHVTVADDRAAIADAIRQACRRADLVIVTGGLGPTPDDVTREGLADALGQPLVVDESCVRQLAELFRALDRAMPESNKKQTMVPKGSRPLPNPRGTAPGIRASLGDAAVHVLPGVPEEMRGMFRDHVLPRLAGAGTGATVVRAIRCFGAAEARIAERIADLMRPRKDVVVGITAHEAVISVRVLAHGASVEAARTLATSVGDEIMDRLGSVVFGADDQTLSGVVAARMLELGATVSTAESCTGGMLGKVFTDVSGSSGYYAGGVVAYSNAVKTGLLGVAAETIGEFGAVSAETARAMAKGCRQVFGTTYALSVTGIAGPEGGSPEKPVGLVYVGLATSDDVSVLRLLLGAHRSRNQIRDWACKSALDWLRMELMGVGRAD